MVKSRKIIVTMVVMLLIFVLFASVCNAYAPGDMLNDTTAMATADATGSGANAITSITNTGKAVITIARVITAGIAVAMLVAVAIKYMVSAPSDRADIKKHAVIYVVGAIIMFATTGILGIIEQFADSIGK